MHTSQRRLLLEKQRVPRRRAPTAEVKAKLRLESKQAVHNYFPPLAHLFVSLGMREGERGILALPGDGSLMKVFLGNDLGG